MGLTVSVYLQEETLAKLREKVRGNVKYRNKSHLIECAIEKYLREE
ncbi:ribbon-helix-helix protein, CopG family [Candidatus Pacearchaeota archaeon]|nr:ribbon-helix-helix protein, CopG family [Candidatus Pacearchaeota archaeon]